MCSQALVGSHGGGSTHHGENPCLSNACDGKEMDFVSMGGVSLVRKIREAILVRMPGGRAPIGKNT
jgi:hypothetical protein